MVPVWFHLIPSDHSSLSGGTVPSLGSPSRRIAGISYCWQSLEYLSISYSAPVLFFFNHLNNQFPRFNSICLKSTNCFCFQTKFQMIHYVSAQWENLIFFFWPEIVCMLKKKKKSNPIYLVEVKEIYCKYTELMKFEICYKYTEKDACLTVCSEQA